jgi:hypothetical protein
MKKSTKNLLLGTLAIVGLVAIAKATKPAAKPVAPPTKPSGGAIVPNQNAE